MLQGINPADAAGSRFRQRRFRLWISPDNVRGCGRDRSELMAQEPRIQLQVGELVEVEPAKAQLRGCLTSAEPFGPGDNWCGWRKLHEKIEGDFVPPSRVPCEEVLDDPEQPTNLNFDPKLFAQFALEGQRRRFQQLGVTAG